VRYLGVATPDSLSGLLQAVDIVFLPSAIEGIALMQFEAMAAGKVFVGADVGGQREVISEGCNCGYLNDIKKKSKREQAEGYYTLLKSLVMDGTSKLTEIGENARKVIEKSFTVDHMGECINKWVSEESMATKNDAELSYKEKTALLRQVTNQWLPMRLKF
jgi:glycosyltransferase involved in cell wall biosynthesis